MMVLDRSFLFCRIILRPFLVLPGDLLITLKPAWNQVVIQKTTAE